VRGRARSRSGARVRFGGVRELELAEAEGGGEVRGEGGGEARGPA